MAKSGHSYAAATATSVTTDAAELLFFDLDPELLFQLVEEGFALIALLIGQLGDHKDSNGREEEAWHNRVQA